MKINRHKKFNDKMRADGGRMILFRLSPELTEKVDKMVADERYGSRSAVARHAIEKLIDSYQSQ